MKNSELTSHDVRAVANYMLDRADARKTPLTLMQLLKLLYIAHGWSLAFGDTPIISNQPQAWQYGPVYPHVYKAFSGSGSGPLKTRIADRTTGAVPYAELSASQKLLIEDVLASYGSKHAFELSNITHMPGTPWADTFEKIGKYSEIPLEKMKEHYKALKLARRISEARYSESAI